MRIKSRNRDQNLKNKTEMGTQNLNKQNWDRANNLNWDWNLKNKNWDENKEPKRISESKKQNWDGNNDPNKQTDMRTK